MNAESNKFFPKVKSILLSTKKKKSSSSAFFVKFSSAQPVRQINKISVGEVRGLTVLTVSSGGLSLMSVMLISAVAVLDKPKFRLPSMSVAWTMMVYWETFCKWGKYRGTEKHSQGSGLTRATTIKQSQNI